MASIFCPNCGSKSEYQFSAPNFCSKCGSAYIEKNKKNLSVASQSNLKKNQVQDNFEDEEYEDDENQNDETFSSSTRVPRISSLKVDIDHSSDIRVVKMSDLANGNFTSSSLQLGKRQNIDEVIDERK
jgi:hypothetical protein